MTIHADPAKDPGKDPRRARFEKMRDNGGTYAELVAIIREFVALGHNPKDPTDEMYVILGITPEFLETMMFTLRTHPDATLDEFAVDPQLDPSLSPAPLDPEPVDAAQAETPALADMPPPAPAEEPAIKTA